MSTQSILHRNHDPDVGAPLTRQWIDPSQVVADARGQRRSKIWELSPNLHCSIIGTCLTAAELRQFFVKLRDVDAKTASDHSLHGRGVRAAGQHDVAGKLLNKALDKRHETVIKRFAKCATTAEVRDVWLHLLEQGDIPGAYWAVLTHPATDRALVQEVFGEVHMLSHMVGASNRVDIARLRKLERELAERDDKIARQEVRLSAAWNECSELLGRVSNLEAEIGQILLRNQARAGPTANGDATCALLHRLNAERGHASALAERLKKAEERARAAEKRAAELMKANGHLQLEIAALEGALGPQEVGGNDPDALKQDLRGLALVYVGGRPKLTDQLKAAVAQRGGNLLAHDGGVEDNIALLPGLVSQADAVFFPVDCISHDAAGKVKKLSRRLGKPFVPLRTASVASFVAAIAKGDFTRRAETAVAD